MTLSAQQIIRPFSRRHLLVGVISLTAFGNVLVACSNQTPIGADPTATPSQSAATPTPQPQLSRGTTRLVYRGHSSGITALAWSPDGSRIASGSDDQTVQIWDAMTGEHVFIYRGHSSGVDSVAWSPDGTHIGSSGGGHAQVWEVTTGKRIAEYGSDSEQVYQPSWSPDGTYLAFSDSNGVQIWQVASGKRLLTHPSSGGAPKWSPDGTAIASFGFNAARNLPTIQIWNARTGKTLLSYEVPGDRTSDFAWSPTSKKLVYAGSSGLVEARDSATGQQKQTYQSKATEWVAVGWSPDGKYIAAGSINDIAPANGMVRIWNANTGKQVYTLQKQNDVQALTWSPDSQLLASVSGNTVQVWQAA